MWRLSWQRLDWKSRPIRPVGSPVVIVVGGFLAAIPWLKHQDDTLVLTLAPVASIFVMGYSLFVAQKAQRRLDVVEIANQGCASARGWVWGAMATTVALMLPPVTNVLIDLANAHSTGSADTSDRGAVRLALFVGFMLVVVVQLLAVIVASTIRRRMKRG